MNRRPKTTWGCVYAYRSFVVRKGGDLGHVRALGHAQ